jgi:hypothetical protein
MIPSQFWEFCDHEYIFLTYSRQLICCISRGLIIIFGETTLIYLWSNIIILCK